MLIDRDLKSCPFCGGKNIADWGRAPDRFHLRKQEYILRRCKGCSLVWQNDPPPPEAMSAHYSRSYHQTISHNADTSSQRWKQRQAQVLQYKREGTLLDLGCSSGALLAAFQGDSWKLFGIELDPLQAQTAMKRTGAQVFIGDVLDAPFLPDSFDVITCFHVLEHHYQPQQLLEKVQEWLKPGGVFILVLPNIDSWEANFFRSYWFGLEMPRHLFHFSPMSLRQLTSSIGLETVRLVTPSDSYMEHSVRYVFDDWTQRAGFLRVPLSEGLPASIPLKVVRKAFRLSFELAFSRISSHVGRGASIEAVFRKPSSLASTAGNL
jgi:SAM-dependent methyltransferase